MFDSIRKRLSKKTNANKSHPAQIGEDDGAFSGNPPVWSLSDIPPELLARLMSIRTDAELRKLVEEHPELLPVIQQMANQSQASQESSTDVSSPGDLLALLRELQVLKRLSDMPRRVELCQNAIRLVDRNNQPKLWSDLQNDLGNSLAQNPLGPRAENIDLAIDHYNQSLQVLTREAFPEHWAMTQNNLAAAYNNRIRGDRAENIDLAIDHFKQALQVLTCEAFPEQWAMTQNNLAVAYSDRIRGERAENIDLAIDHCNQALQVRTLERFPADRRQTLRNLGNLHFTEQSWKNALDGYDGAIEAGNAVLAEAHTEVGRKAEVWETSGLYARSAYCLLKLEQIDKAVIRLEEGKTRMLTEALALADADLDMLSKKRVKQYVCWKLRCAFLLTCRPVAATLNLVSCYAVNVST